MDLTWAIQGKDLSTLVAWAVVLLAGVAKGVAGMGIPVVATPVMDVLFGIKVAIPLTVLPTIFTDIVIVVGVARRDVLGHFPRILRLVVPAIVGVVIGVRILERANPDLLASVMGLVVVSFVLSSLFKVRWHWDASWPGVDIMVGFVAGLMQGAVGASGPIVSIYLYGFEWPRRDFLFVFNSFVIVVDTIQFLSLWQIHLMTSRTFSTTLWLFGPAIGGLTIAFLLRRRITPKVFQATLLTMLSVTAVTLVGKGLGFAI